MIIGFGYVAMSMTMENASPSKNVTYANFKKIAEHDPQAALNKLRRVAKKNIKPPIWRF